MKKNYQFASLHQIIECFAPDELLTPSEIAQRLGKSRAIVHRYIGHLLEIGQLERIGSTPHVQYRLAKSREENYNTKNNTSHKQHLAYPIQKRLNTTFLKFSPLGERQEGYVGFERWCTSRGLDMSEKASQYLKINDYIESLRDDCGLLDATNVFEESFEKKVFSHVYYADQYTWMEFGRGRLAELTFYAKLTQNKPLLDEAIEAIFTELVCLLSGQQIDAIAIVPWSIDRKHQLLGMLAKKLKSLDIPQLPLVKYYKNNIAIPQKSLKTKNERIQNAQQTIFVEDMAGVKQYKKILLIDDFVGSGATLYETALKIRDAGVSEIIGFAWVGNTNLKYEVINEI